MERIGRLLLAGVVAGLIISVFGTAGRLVATPWLTGFKGLRETNFQGVIVGFFFDLLAGWLAAGAYALASKANAVAFWRRAGGFFLLLLFLSVVPRAAEFYRLFALPGPAVMIWAGAALVQSIFVAVVIALICPPAKPAGPEG